MGSCPNFSKRLFEERAIKTIKTKGADSSQPDLNVFPVQVQAVVLVVEDLGRVRVAWVARHVVREHEDDVVVRDAQPFHRTVQGQRVGNVPVIEPG